jgi:undecaprenyl-diphosphatase
METMPIVQVIILAIVQGLAELLPVSSSAHVVVAEKLLGLDPASPQMTLVLVMLHTGTMFAVIAYFWKQWRRTYFASADAFKRALVRIIGEAINKVIEKTVFKGAASKDIEQLFGRLDLVAPALAAAGVLILIAGVLEKRRMGAFVDHHSDYRDLTTVTMRQAGWIGAVQGLCLPFRGFSRSGATISIGMLTGATKERAERFSFALAVVLTPPVVLREVLRLVKATHAAAAAGNPVDLHGTVMSALLGAVFAFLAGLVALRWLSSWLETGRWYLFGIYCLVASGVVFYLHTIGY